MAPYGKPAPSVFAEVWEKLLSPRTATGVLPRDQTWRALLWAAALGILAVTTGFAGFVAWVAETKELKQVVSILVVVSVVAAIVEKAREIITHGSNKHGRAMHRQERLSRTILTILAGFILVLLFEIANAAWDKGADKLTETLRDVISLGHEPIETRIRLLAVVLMWIAAGAVVSIVLVRRILSMEPATEAVVPRASPAPEVIPRWQALAASWLGPLWSSRGLRSGVATAAIAAGACALLFFASVLLLDGGLALYKMTAAYGDWRADVDKLDKSAGIIGYLARPALWLDALLNSWFLPILQRLWWLFALGAGYLWWHSPSMRVIMIAAVVAVVFVPPVAVALPELLRISMLFAAVWAFPAFLLGALSPYLRDYRPQQWGFYACIVGLGLGLLAALQAYLGISDVLTITVICAAFTLLIGLILIFSPPTRDYLPLIALVCSLISYTFAAYLAVQYHIIESIVFLHAQESEPKRLGDAKALAPPSRFVLSLDGRDWEIGKEIHGKVEHIVKLKRKHERWVETHELLGYVNYLRDPVKHRWVGRLLDLLPIGEAARISNRHLFIGTRIGRDWPKPGEPCALSPIDCLAALELAPESGVRPDWTMPMLKAWTSKVTEALKSDLRWRWRDESIGPKLHIALSAAIGFFLALAALIAWQIRSATEASPRPHTGWQ